MASRTWIPGSGGDYLNPANWEGGVAPGPGDSVLIAGAGSAPHFYAPGNDPIKFSPDPAPPGYTVSGETITLQADGDPNSLSATIQAEFSNTTLAADTTLNVAGTGIAQVAAWFDDTLDGTINVANAAGGAFRLELWSDWPKNNQPPPDNSREGLPTTTNAGVINVAGDGGEFWLYPVTGGSAYHLDDRGNWVLLNPATGWADFVNRGEINVAPGGTFLDRGSAEPQGLYFHEFWNYGTINVHGAAGKQAAAIMDANLVGNGGIIVDGGTQTDASQTQFALTGPMYGGSVYLRSASMFMMDKLDYVRAAGGSVTFEDGNSYLFLKPSLNEGPSPGSTDPAFQTQGLADPFGATIRGFRAGDTIAIGRNIDFGESFSTQWDQASHHLSVISTNTFNGTATTVAQFTLDGTYSADEFQVYGDISPTGHEVLSDINDPLYGPGSYPAQIDIVTTHQAAPNIAWTNTTTHASGTLDGDAYSGPVQYLQWQYIWSDPGDASIAANVPNAFLHGGAGDDALAASAGSNVLDGGTGSNFLVGATGADGGTDTFFVDARGGGTTWSTVVNFHAGDTVTFWGFDGTRSAYDWSASDGAAGYQGATIHAATGGAGTPVDASLTFAGLSLADAQSHFTVSTGSVGGQSYMAVQYNH